MLDLTAIYRAIKGWNHILMGGVTVFKHCLGHPNHEIGHIDLKRAPSPC